MAAEPWLARHGLAIGLSVVVAIVGLDVLLGAEINAEAEQQTVKDTTTGPGEPLGQRGAVKADNLPHEQPTEKKQG